MSVLIPVLAALGLWGGILLARRHADHNFDRRTTRVLRRRTYQLNMRVKNGRRSPFRSLRGPNPRARYRGKR